MADWRLADDAREAPGTSAAIAAPGVEQMTTAATPRADLSNWRTPPFIEWGFQHVSEIISCAEIPRGAGDVWPLATAARSLDAFSLPVAGGEPLDLAGFHAATATDAMVVLLDGQVVYEVYDHGMTPTTPHILMSASKSVIGLVSGIMAGMGWLDLDAPVASLVPEVADSAWRGASLRHLLDMRTGVKLDEAGARAYEAASGWDPVAPNEAAASLHAFFPTVTTGGPHGGPFAYVSANIDLLGWAIERATGKTVAEVIGALLWRPLGAEADAAITLDRAGAARCTGGVIATARDLARLGQLVLQGGRRGDTQIVPEAWIDDLSNGGDVQAWADGEWGPLFTPVASRMSYRGGWYAIADAPATLFAMGIHGQNLFVDRANRLVIAKLSSQGERFDYRAAILTHRAVAEIRRCLIG
jgi:CubicO group peptidase (beta-lactamase class C family)